MVPRLYQNGRARAEKPRELMKKCAAVLEGGLGVLADPPNAPNAPIAQLMPVLVSQPARETPAPDPIEPGPPTGTKMPNPFL